MKYPYLPTRAQGLLRRTLGVWRAEIEAGVPVVALEPSCLAVFRDEMPDLFPYDEDAKRLRNQIFTLAEFLQKKAPHLQPPQLHLAAIVHGHCHQKAVIGTDPEQELLHNGTRLDDAGTAAAEWPEASASSRQSTICR